MQKRKWMFKYEYWDVFVSWKFQGTVLFHSVMKTKLRHSSLNSCESCGFPESSVLVAEILQSLSRVSLSEQASSVPQSAFQQKISVIIFRYYLELHTESTGNEFKMKKRAERCYKTLCVEVIQYLPSRELVLGGSGAVAMGKYLEVFQHCFTAIFACNTLKAIICCLRGKEQNDLCLLCFSWHVCCPRSWVGWDCCLPGGRPLRDQAKPSARPHPDRSQVSASQVSVL